MTRDRSLASLFALALLLAAPDAASAQEMGQGAAHITTRSDVRLSMESVPGTSGTRLTAMGRAIGAGMSGIRECYASAVQERPTVTGTVRLRVTLGAAGAPALHVDDDGPRDRGLLNCVRGVIGRRSMSDVDRPAAAIVVLEFQNTAAAGAAETARRADEADEVPVSRDGGRPTATGEAPGVQFVVRGAERVRDEHVAEALRVVRSQIAGMLDCRRRASRRGMNPEGQIDLAMRMRARHAPELRVVRSTVQDERAPICLQRALERPHRTPEAGPAQIDVEVRFLPGAE